VHNWAGNVTFAATQLHRPRTVDELQQLVAASPRIRALGTGHSFNRIADSSGELVTVADIAGETVVDEMTMTAEVRAGATYGQVGADLAAAGWALHNLGSLPHISVAGACATGTHGSGDTNACLAAAAVAVEFVRADGELVRVPREDPAFPGSVLALGALGVVTRLTLAIEPAFEVRQDVWLDAPLATVLDRFADIMASGYSVSLFTDWSRPHVIDKIWVKSRTDTALVDGREWGARAADAPQHPITGEDPTAATVQLGAPGSWHERLPHFRAEFTPSVGHEQQSEYLLPREHGPAALLALRTLDLRAALAVCEVRTVAADELWLSPCHDRDTVAFHFTWVDDDELVHRAVQDVERAFAPFDPRPHWGKVFAMQPAEIAAHYPQLAGVRELAAVHDPERCFGNEFLDRYLFG
jgi:xylitol oxidase